MRVNNICFYGVIWKIIPVTPSYLKLYDEAYNNALLGFKALNDTTPLKHKKKQPTEFMSAKSLKYVLSMLHNYVKNSKFRWQTV